MGDGDNDQQVEDHSEQRGGGQQDVNQQCIGGRTSALPAREVEELRKAELSFLYCVHHQRGGDHEH